MIWYPVTEVKQENDMYTFRILMALGGLLLIVVYIIAFQDMIESRANLTRQEAEIAEQEASQERSRHCRMLWGDSKYFSDCQAGTTITPRSGMIN